MMAAVSRAVMALAISCVGAHRQQWALAMRAEFEEALEDGRPLAFAVGCLTAAWRLMPTHEEGRFVLTAHALVLSVMIPMATLQIGCAILGFPYLFPGQDGLRGALKPGGAQELLLGGVYLAALPSLTVLLLVLGAGHLRLAWLILERDWSRLVSTGALTLAATVTLVIFMGVLFLNGTQAMLQAAVLVIELGVISILALWHAQLPLSAPPENAAR
jgi:hypothetical protein